MTSLLIMFLAAAPDVNLLSLEAGGVPLTQAWDGVRVPQAFVEVDANTSRSGSAGKGPISIVYELEQRSALMSVDARDNRPEAQAPASLEVWISQAGPSEGFVRVATLTLKQSAVISHAALPKDTLARWVRLVVNGKEDVLNSALLEVLVNGHPLEPSFLRPFTGAWSLGDNGVLRLATDGATITGCAAWSDKVWTIRGTAHGRTAEVTWRDETNGSSGTAIAALGDDGALRGRWREENSNTREAWLGIKRPDAAFDCRAAVDDQNFAHRVGKAQPGNLLLSGVGFDANTDDLRLETRNDLGALERILAKASGQRARIFVLGRSTEPPADELKRCERRAQKLLAHLGQAGVSASAVELAVGIVKLNAVQPEPRVEVLLLGEQ